MNMGNEALALSALLQATLTTMQLRAKLRLAVPLVAILGAVSVALHVGSGHRQPPLPQYRTDLTLEELMSLEYQRLKDLHESRRTSELNPSVKAIVDDFASTTNADEFQKRLGRELLGVYRVHAQAFADRHPGLLEDRRRRAAATLIASAESKTVQLPGALGQEEWWLRLWDLFKAMAPNGLEGLDPGELNIRTWQVSTFLEESEDVHTRLRLVLAGHRITHRRAQLDWDDPAPLCFPPGFRDVIVGRILVLLAAGQHAKAFELTEALMELIERSDMGASNMGLLHLVVISSAIIHYAIVPCAKFGAVSPDRLADFAERGRRLAVRPTEALVEDAEFLILSFLGPAWDRAEAGTPSLPAWLHRRYGPQPIDVWLKRVDEVWPADIRNFEQGRAMSSDARGDVDSLAGLTRCIKFCTKYLLPLVHSISFVRIHEPIGSRSEWSVLLLRAEEIRRGKSFLEFADEAEQLLLDPWVEVHKHTGYWELRHNIELWASLGHDVANVPPVCRIAPIKTGSSANE